MIEIVKHGIYRPKFVRLRCRNCECEFDVTKDDCEYEPNSNAKYSDGNVLIDILIDFDKNDPKIQPYVIHNPICSYINFNKYLDLFEYKYSVRCPECNNKYYFTFEKMGKDIVELYGH